MTTGLLPHIATRQSVTNWTREPISADAWDLLFEAARRAPSSWNRQPARYVAVTDRASIRKLSEVIHRCNRWAARAAGLVVQMACPADDDRVDGKEYYLYDCGLAMMSLVYQAQAMGITARQMIGWDESDIRVLLGIPERYRIVVVVGLGYPAKHGLSATIAARKRQITAQHKRFATGHIVHWQRFGGRAQ
ncbi:MAG: nitroreductase family protein [Bacilli bacterium]